MAGCRLTPELIKVTGVKTVKLESAVTYLKRGPAQGEDDDDDDDHAGHSHLVLLPLALVPGVSGRPRTVGRRAAPPEPEQHVHVQPEDAQQRQSQHRDEDDHLRRKVTFVLKMAKVENASCPKLKTPAAVRAPSKSFM